MKKIVSLFLILAMMMSLAACQSGADDAQASADPTISAAVTPADSGKSTDADPAAQPNNPNDGSQDKAPLDEAQPVNYRPTHSMDATEVVTSYLAGDWKADQPLWSEDYSTRVAVQSDGSLIYTLRECVNFCNDSELSYAKRLANNYCPPETKDPTDPDAESTRPVTPMPLPPSWPGEKVYVDLPGQVLPEDALTSAYVVGEGTLVQTPQGVTLYRQEEVIDTWAAEAKECSFLAARSNSRLGENFLLVDDQLLKLVSGGTTEVVYDHVVDAGHSAIPFLTVLTIEDGVLSEHYYWEGKGWKDIKIVSDVAEARFGLGAAIFRTTDGMAFVVTPRVYYNDPKTTVACVGERTLDNLEGLWESFDDNYGPSNHPNIADKLMAFLTKYSSAALVISDPVTSGDSCDPYDGSSEPDIGGDANDGGHGTAV